ncbi:TRAP transporter TatT component family protein [Saccharospirillum alexandrii]|uniref:TRAP transporter TatT component family protein n=1 Tax=Saccharospirillum alexandrii TaxID=2448477 RepID=UPI000FDAF9DA|nr:TRAP transporter TatT component family protein [Saccharospirillum alexandrii]
MPVIHYHRIQPLALRGFLVLLLGLVLSGCATRQLPSNLSSAILNNDDLQTVEDGLPSYLLMIDALVETYPDSEQMQLTAASLNSAYAGVFIPPEQAERRRAMSAKALNYAFSAFCTYDDDACGLREVKPDQIEAALSQWDHPNDLPYLYTLGTAWASYIQNNSDDWLAVAQLGQAQAVLERTVAIEPGYERGTALLYLGVMNSILPPSLGGKPGVAQAYYEQALDAADGQNLIIQVYYASQFARLVFDRELHDRLLQDALSRDPYVEGLTLQNRYAQQQAEQLLASADDYF